MTYLFGVHLLSLLCLTRKNIVLIDEKVHKKKLLSLQQFMGTSKNIECSLTVTFPAQLQKFKITAVEKNGTVYNAITAIT